LDVNTPTAEPEESLLEEPGLTCCDAERPIAPASRSFSVCKTRP